MIRNHRKKIMCVIMITTLMVGCMSGCGQKATKEPVIWGAPVSTMTEEAVAEQERVSETVTQEAAEKGLMNVFIQRC